MIKVFLGGSRNVSRLSPEVQERLNNIINKGHTVLIGDANGADKAAQKYFKDHSYNQVEVFCMEGVCRNNLGPWPVRSIPSYNSKKDFDYYSMKDRVMAEEANVGLMIWDGKSRGTLTNVYRLVHQNKKVVVYSVPLKQFTSLNKREDWENFLLNVGVELREKIEKNENKKEQKYRKPIQRNLFSENRLNA